MKTETCYIVHFKDLGYYAEKQPNYAWSFTDDIQLAKRYKTIKGANKQAIHGEECSYNTRGIVIECEFEFVVPIITIVGGDN